MKTLARCVPLAVVVAVVLLLHGVGGGASSPLAVAVAKAATVCPQGFTVTVVGLPAGSAPTSSLSEACVLTLGIPAGATGATGAAGAAGQAGAQGPPGASGLSGLARYSTTKNVTTGLSTATAMCPRGKKAISGGADSRVNSELEQVAITADEPTANDQGWTATTNSRAVSTKGVSKRVRVSLTVTVICAVVAG
jgi:hypothetical protein